jgi:hypothetical protein
MGILTRLHCARLLHAILAILFSTVVALSSTGADAQAANSTQQAIAPPPAAQAPSMFPDPWFPPAILSLYKTITYTVVVLTTDQLWYMGTAAQAATTSGIFGVVNLITSPMLTYVFEYTWERCCEAPPGPDGVRPIDVKKAIIYRVLSTSRIFALALLFGNGMSSSLLVTGAIAATRTLVYMSNDYLWNHLTAQTQGPLWRRSQTVTVR